MDKNSIIVGEGRDPKPRPGDPIKAWRLVSWFGALFALVGAADLLLGLVPSDWATAAGRFTALTGAAGGLPVLTMGLVTLAVAAAARGAGTASLVAATLSVIAAVLVLVGLVVFLGARGETLAGAPEAAVPVIRTAVTRTVLFGLVMAAVLGFTGTTLLIDRGTSGT